MPSTILNSKWIDLGSNILIYSVKGGNKTFWLATKKNAPKPLQKRPAWLKATPAPVPLPYTTCRNSIIGCISRIDAPDVKKSWWNRLIRCVLRQWIGTIPTVKKKEWEGVWYQPQPADGKELMFEDDAWATDKQLKAPHLMFGDNPQLLWDDLADCHVHKMHHLQNEQHLRTALTW